MKHFAAIIISMVIWGSIGIFTRYAAQPPEVIVFFRVFSAALTLAPFIIKNTKKEKGFPKKTLKILILSGVFLSLNWLFFFKAVQTTTIAKATLSYYTAPVIVTLLSPILLKERLERRTIISIMFAFAGVALIILFPLSGILSGQNSGIIFGLCAAFFYSLVTITAKLLWELSPVKLAFYQAVISTIIFTPFAVLNINININSILIMVAIGILHTSIALTLYFYGVKGVKAQYAGVLSYIDPLSAVIFGFLVFNEIPSSSTIAGGVLILISSLIILRKKKV